jgi:hypothetical protein
MSKLNAKDVLRKLVDTIEATGGVTHDRKGLYRPAGDEDWVDLGDVYVQACRALGKEPMVVEEDEPGPAWECVACGDVNDEQDMGTETDVAGFICPACGSGNVRLVEDDSPVAHIQVEYDLNYTGGDYSKTGNLAYVPCSLIDEAGSVEAAFQRHTGHNPIHIVHHSPDELYTADGEPFEDE